MKKAKIPPNAELYRNRCLYNKKKDPIWVELEKEMQDNATRGIKPYNKKVGDWLEFMKELHHYYYTIAKRNYNKMKKAIGPAWFIEFSQIQRDILRKMSFEMHADIFENRPTRTKQCLAKLGFTIDFNKEMLMTAMEISIEDPGIFFWELYKLQYNMSPNEPRKHYDENARLMMSALVFVDLEECRKELYRVTAKKPPPPPEPPKKQQLSFKPNVRFGEYLEQLYVPCVSNHPDKVPKRKKPLPILTKVKLRSAKSYENLRLNNKFLEDRKERNIQLKPKERACNYKFWKAPSSLRNTDPKMVSYILKMTMFKKRPRPKYLKSKPALDNIQINVKGVSYSFGRPIYHLDGINTLTSGYTPISGGYVNSEGEYIINILGFVELPHENKAFVGDCNCKSKWMKHMDGYLDATRCYCNHYYDLDVKKNEAKPKAKYFHLPKNDAPFYVDYAKVYQFDDWDEFIKEGVEEALDSNIVSPAVSAATVMPSKLKSKELLEAFLADLSSTPLIIPHLPDAHLLKELQELVRQRVKGNLTEKTKKRLMLKSKRDWLNLGHLDFNSRAYMIPFTEKQLDSLNFSHRYRLQKLCDKMLKNFSSRTRKMWLEHTRLLWNTMRYEINPNKSFLDAFFTYMPVREMDLFVYNPYSTDNTPKYGAKTCRLQNRNERWPDYLYAKEQR